MSVAWRGKRPSSTCTSISLIRSSRFVKLSESAQADQTAPSL